MASAKLVVTKARGGSKISLVGTSGTELLSSKVFVEPRGKGATLRALKGLLGENIVVDDQTVATAQKRAAAAAQATVITQPAKEKATKTPTRSRRSRAS